MASYADVIAGLEILAKHAANGRKTHGIDAQHEIIFAGPDVTEDKLPLEDVEALKVAGWRWDQSVHAWARFT